MKRAYKIYILYVLLMKKVRKKYGLCLFLSNKSITCTTLPTLLVMACIKWALLYTPSAATHLSCGPRARGDLKIKSYL